MTQPLGLQHAGLLRPARRVRRGRGPPGRRRRVQGHGQAAARGGHRGDPRRRLQPHGRAGPRRARRCRGAGWTTAPTTGSTSRGRDVDVTGCGNTLDLRHPMVCRMVLDSLRYWVAGVPRRRLPLRPRRGPRPRPRRRLRPRPPVPRRRCAPTRCSRRVKLIAEPWDVGLHGWRTGQFPPPFAEWNDRFRDTVRDFWLRDRAAAGAGSRARRAGAGHPPGRLAGPVRRARPRAARVGQLRRRPRRLHAGRPDAVQPQAQRGQRRGQPRRQRQQPVVEPRRRGPDRGRAAIEPRRRRRCATCWHAAALDRGADARRRRRDSAAPRAATTTPTARTTDLLVRLGPRALAARPARDDPAPRPAAPRHPGAAPAHVLRRAAGRTRTAPPTWRGSTPTGEPMGTGGGTTRPRGPCRCTRRRLDRPRRRRSWCCTAAPTSEVTPARGPGPHGIPAAVGQRQERPGSATARRQPRAGPVGAASLQVYRGGRRHLRLLCPTARGVRHRGAGPLGCCCAGQALATRPSALVLASPGCLGSTRTV